MNSSLQTLKCVAMARAALVVLPCVLTHWHP